MAGKLNNGAYPNCSCSKLAKAMCEGRRSKIDGISANPHTAGSEDYTAWQYGYDNYNLAGTLQNPDCCADLPKV